MLNTFNLDAFNCCNAFRFQPVIVGCSLLLTMLGFYCCTNAFSVLPVIVWLGDNINAIVGKDKK